MAQTAKPDLPLDDLDFIVPVDFACSGCGYNLRAQRMGGQCPECGQPVQRSAMGDEMKYANPRWLYQLRVGVLILLGCSVFGAVWHYCTRIDQTIITSVWNWPESRSLVTGTWIARAVLHLVGIWLICRPDPRTVGGRGLTLERLTFIAACVVDAAIVLSFTEWVTPRGGFWNNIVFYFAFRLPTFIFNVGLAICVWWIVRRWAKRMNARALAAACVIILLLFAPAWLMLITRDTGYTIVVAMRPGNVPYMLHDVLHMLSTVLTYYVILPIVLQPVLLAVVYFRLRNAERFAGLHARAPGLSHAETGRPSGDDHEADEDQGQENRPAGVGGTPGGP